MTQKMTDIYKDIIVIEVYRKVSQLQLYMYYAHSCS